MKPISFTISKNAIILTLLTLLSGVIVFDQIKIRKQEALLKLMEQPIYYMNSDTIATATLVRNVNTDSLLEANKLLKKKVDYYFEYYRESLEQEPDTFKYWEYPADLRYNLRFLPDTIWYSPFYPNVKPHPFPMDSVWINVADSIKRTFMHYNYL